MSVYVCVCVQYVVMELFPFESCFFVEPLKISDRQKESFPILFHDVKVMLHDVAFPRNQFAHQEPGSHKDILKFLETFGVRDNYGQLNEQLLTFTPFCFIPFWF